MCECIEKLEKKVSQKYGRTGFFECKTLTEPQQLFSEIVFPKEEKQKKRIVNMLYSYCPFCGEKIKREKEG